MKKIALILSLFSGFAFAQSSNEKFNHHELTLTKEETKHFLFFPYKTKTIVSKLEINGEDGYYKKEKTIKNEKLIYEDKSNSLTFDDFKFVELNALITNHDNKQLLVLDSSEIIGTNHLKFDNGSEIFIPTIDSKRLVLDIVNKQMESTWTNDKGDVYHLEYLGDKI